MPWRKDGTILKKTKILVTRKTSWTCACPKKVERNEGVGESRLGRRGTEEDGGETRRVSGSLEFSVRNFVGSCRFDTFAIMTSVINCSFRQDILRSRLALSVSSSLFEAHLRQFKKFSRAENCFCGSSYVTKIFTLNVLVV